MFQSRILRLAKDTEQPEQIEDEFGIDPSRAVAVVADGVASAIFSRQWAEILTAAVIADPPQPEDKDAFARWVAQRRQTWSELIDTGGLAWFQKAKLPWGAFSTLLWVGLSPIEDQQPGTFGAYRLRAFAVGDSCLFHVRHGETLRTFPIQKSDEFKDDPVVLGSVDLSRDQLVEFRSLDAACCPDDLLVLCTDAVADWALRRIESGNPPAWDRLWNVTEEDWQQEVVRLRQQREMRCDDATLMLLKVVEQGVSASEQVADQIDKVSGRLARGWKKWKQKAVEKYREKFGPHDR